MAEVELEVTGAREVGVRFGKVPDEARARLRVAVMSEALRNEARIKEKLSGEVLNVVTGALRASIFTAWVTDDETEISAHTASGGVAYAGAHEFGAIIPAHEVVAKAGGMLRFEIAGQVLFRRSVMIPDVRIPERSYLRSTLAERREEIVTSLREAVQEAVRS